MSLQAELWPASDARQPDACQRAALGLATGSADRLREMRETSKWLHAGRRWRMSPTLAQVNHCRHWWVNVSTLMRAHGWRVEIYETPTMEGCWTAVWRTGGHEVCGAGIDPYYAAVTAAAIAKRKAKHYQFWEPSFKLNTESRDAGRRSL